MKQNGELKVFDLYLFLLVRCTCFEDFICDFYIIGLFVR